MSIKNPYADFGRYVLRTPIFPVNFFLELTKEKNVKNNQLKEAFKDKVVKESIYLASPSLYKDIQRWINNDIKNFKKIEKIKLSFFKYLTRMSTRCTPFGLFAGCSVGEFRNETRIEIKEGLNHSRYSRLDHEFLIKTTKKLTKNRDIRDKLKFYPNTSIYFLNREIRYVETDFTSIPRKHKTVSIQNNPLLIEVLKFADKGVLIIDIVNFISNDEISHVDAKEFVNDLINSQILISELEPNILGIEYFDRVLNILKRIKHSNDELNTLEKKIKKLDKSIGNDIDKYLEIFEHNSKEINGQNIIKTDLFIKTDTNTIDKRVVKDIKRGLDFLNKISLDKERQTNKAFINTFNERYGERMVPLAKVMDVEMGIGYLQDSRNKGLAPIIDDIDIPIIKKSTMIKERINRGDMLLINKSQNIKPENILKLTDEDVDEKNENWIDFKLDWNNTHDTIGAIVQIVEEKGVIKYISNFAQGPSGASLLSRFGFGDNEIEILLRDITNFEKQAVNDEDVAIAEVSYLTKKRIGGVSIRQDLREYEIPYLINSNKPRKNQILLNELYVYVEKGVVKIWSDKLDKQVLPKVTDAHYYDYGSLPFYHFLYEIQYQKKRLICSFHWNNALKEVAFLPRVEYQNIIFSLALWRFNTVKIKHIIDELNDEIMMDKVEQWRKEIELPDFAMLIGSGKELVINFKNAMSVRALLSTVKGMSHFTLTEFLFSKSGIVKRGNEFFTNELMIPLYNSNKIK